VKERTSVKWRVKKRKERAIILTFELALLCKKKCWYFYVRNIRNRSLVFSVFLPLSLHTRA
jgi:hypothetical protein